MAWKIRGRCCSVRIGSDGNGGGGGPADVVGRCEGHGVLASKATTSSYLFVGYHCLPPKINHRNHEKSQLHLRSFCPIELHNVLA